MCERKKEGRKERKKERKEKRTNERTDGWTDGRTIVRTKVCWLDFETKVVLLFVEVLCKSFWSLLSLKSRGFLKGLNDFKTGTRHEKSNSLYFIANVSLKQEHAHVYERYVKKGKKERNKKRTNERMNERTDESTNESILARLLDESTVQKYLVIVDVKV